MSLKTATTMRKYAYILASLLLFSLLFSATASAGITYDAGANTITVVGYTEAAPCNFTDIYNADKAGTLSLHARTGITGTDADPVAVDRAERPADYVVLGGTSNDLYITIANWSGTTATIRITGTDRDGTSQTEDITVTANGDYYTTKWFKTITQTQVTAFTGTSFDYDLTQGQWGVVWNQGTDQFTFDAGLTIGSATTTWFADTKKSIIFSDGVMWYGYNSVNVHITLGTRVSDKFGKDGCNIQWVGTSAFYNRLDCVFKAYASSFTADPLNNDFRFLSMRQDESELIDVSFFSMFYCITLKKGSGYNVNLINIENCPIIDSAATMENVFVKNSKYHLEVSYADNVTIKNFVSETPTASTIRAYSYSGNTYLINADLDEWTITWIFARSGKIYRQYEFDLKVIDKDGNNIDGATVKIWDKDSNLIVDTTTDATGVIATQTISRGYYNQANGNTLQEYSPHLIKIEKAGYTLYEADFTLEEKTDWTIALQGVLKRNPAMTGGMV